MLTLNLSLRRSFYGQEYVAFHALAPCIIGIVVILKPRLLILESFPGFSEWA